MTLIKTAVTGAFLLIASTISASAANTYCDKHNCYTPGSNYLTGDYHYLTCKDPMKRLTFVKGHLACVPWNPPKKK